MTDNRALLTDAELMPILRMKSTAFYAAKKAGALDRFKVKGDPIGRAIWSAKLVRLYVSGESTVVLGGRRALRRVS